MCKGQDEVDGTFREEKADPCSEHCQQHTFSEQLTRNSPLACPQRSAHRHFLFPGGGAREQKICDIGTSDDQHQTDGAQQNPERVADVSDFVVQQCVDLHAPGFIGLWILLFQPNGYCIQISPRSLKRDTLF